MYVGKTGKNDRESSAGAAFPRGKVKRRDSRGEATRNREMARGLLQRSEREARFRASIAPSCSVLRDSRYHLFPACGSRHEAVLSS